ncbi:MAG: hypothetical protein IKA36_04780 [Clostridia bacterium]|nr:hypothetical protein [Clostridia bacterium]
MQKLSKKDKIIAAIISAIIAGLAAGAASFFGIGIEEAATTPQTQVELAK